MMFRIGLVVGVILVLLVFLAETGPNCPGMDPAWLGWCK